MNAFAWPDEHAADKFSPAKLSATLDAVVLESLPPVLVGLGVLYLFFALSHTLVLSGNVAFTMSALAAGTAVTLLGLRFVMVRRSIPARWAHPLASIVAGLILLNCLAHLYLVAQPEQTTNLLLLVVGAGFLFLSTRWLILVIFVTLVGWSVTVCLSPPSPMWQHFGFGLISATALSTLVHITRVRTQRRQKGLRLQAERRYRELFEEAPVMYVITRFQEDEAIITDCNQAFLGTLGYSQAEILGKSLAEFCLLDSRAATPVNDCRDVLTGHHSAQECQLVTREGRSVDALVQAVSQTDAWDHVIGTRAMFVDITARKAAEAEIARLYQAESARHQETEALRQTALALASTMALDLVFERILVELQKVVLYDGASVQLLRGEQAEIIAIHGFPDQTQVPGISFSVRDDPLGARVLEARQPVVVDDVQTHDLDSRAAPHVLAGACAWLGVPLFVGDRIIGILTLSKYEPGFYTSAHARLVSTFALQAAIAIENARLYEELDRRVEELAILNMISQAITSTLDLSEILNLISNHITRLLKVVASAVVLRDETRGDLWFAAASGGDADFVRGKRLPLGQGVVGWVVQNGEPLLVPDVLQDARFCPDFDQSSDFTTHSILCVPLRAKGQTIGAIEVMNGDDRDFDERDLQWLSAMATSASTAIENARLYQKAQRGIAERMRAEVALEAERASLARRVAKRTAELRMVNAELARASRLKDEFLANMSHELRTPLNAVLGLSEALQEEVYGPLNEEQLESLHIIEESGRHLLELINDILDIAKIEAGKLHLEMEDVPVEAVCQASLRLVRQAAHKKQLQVSAAFDSAVTMIRADQRRLKQILVNLLSNAVKFTPQGGAIGLEVVGDAEREEVILTIWDTGIGISQEGMEQLFQPFVQLNGGLTRRYEGTGLGLSLVSRLAEIHGGSVSVESEGVPGKGSRFIVALPWRLAEEDSPDDDPNAPDFPDLSDGSSQEDQMTEGESLASDQGQPAVTW